MEKLDGIQNCAKLIVFYASHNRIKSWDEVAKLAVLSELKSVLLIGNSIYGDRDPMDNHPTLVKRVPQLEQCDGKMVSSYIRKVAEEME